MPACKHCGGTGKEPRKITLECVSCQTKVVLTYDENTNLAHEVSHLRCKSCRAEGEVYE